MTLRRNNFVASFAAAVILAAGTLVTTSPAAQAGATVDCAAFGAELRQLVKPSNEVNLLTRWPAEATTATTTYGFTEDLGVVAKVATTASGGLTPVWRLYRAGDFVWATDGSDADAFVADGYSRQFVDFYASTAPQSCLTALNRLERDHVHRVATASQTPGLVADGWVNDGVSFYAGTSGQATPAPAPASDTKFAMALIPDTQNETSSLAGTRFSDRVTWLVSNKASLDLRYAIQIGDLTSWGNVAPAQFEKASNEIKPLEAVVPWSVAAGNHDTAAVCEGGSACLGTDAKVSVRDVSAFNRYFPPSRFGRLAGTFEPNKSENSYATFTAGGKEWLVLTLELWARPAVVAWANDIVKAHPNSNVIVNTHSYLEADGSISTSNGGYGSTSPRYLFDNLIKVHPNIVMVASGHVGQAAARTDVGQAGNTVVSFLQAFHSTTNPVRLVEVDTAAGTVTSRVYAPEIDMEYPQYATSTSGLSFR